MKKLYLYISSTNKDFYIGELFYENNRGEDVFSIELSDEYLKDKKHIYLGPDVFLYSGRQYSNNRIFGFIRDAIPDRFGKLLINKEQIELGNTTKLTDYDYLTFVNDLSRMGALRFKTNKDEPFINEKENSFPPFIYLREVEQASIQLDKNEPLDSKMMSRLLLPNSSLGGARPKANVYFENNVYIAKFPSSHDTYDVELWEYIALSIAKKCGINVPSIRLEKYSDYGHTLLIQRFDRSGNNRVHYMSAITALNTVDGESDNYTYLDLLNLINSQCINPKSNNVELYKRMVFTYLINNTDNHLRNHAFLYSEGYSLSPMFDVNPSFYESEFALPLLYNTNKESLIEASKYFSLSVSEATSIYEQIGKTITDEIASFIKKHSEIKKESELLLSILRKRM